MRDFFMAVKSKKWVVIGSGVLMALLVGLSITWIPAPPREPFLLLPVPSSSSASSTSHAPVINDISCDTMEHFKMHIHAHLDIFIKGKKSSIPSDVGIIPGQCIYWLHTHDDTGVIHIESPENRTFTLGEFFDIWGEKLSNSQIFDSAIGESDNNTLNVYVNGKQIAAGTYFRQTPINAHDEIVIIYGKPPDSIPSSYKFPEGL
jgi:hypothetical protein